MGKILVTGIEKEGTDSCHENRCEALISKIARFKSLKVGRLFPYMTGK